MGPSGSWSTKCVTRIKLRTSTTLILPHLDPRPSTLNSVLDRLFALKTSILPLFTEHTRMDSCSRGLRVTYCMPYKNPVWSNNLTGKNKSAQSTVSQPLSS